MEAHRRTASVDSSYSAFFTSGLLSPPSSPAMSPTSHQSSRVPARVDPSHPLPSSSMLELASPASSYGGDALYFVALLQQMEDDDGSVAGEKDLRELTSFLSIDASSQYSRSTRPAMSSSSTRRSTSTRFPFPSHSQPRSPSSPTASTSSTSTSTSASLSPITPPSYPFSQHTHSHPYQHHSTSHLPKSGTAAATITNTNNATITDTHTSTNIITDETKGAPNNAKIHPRSFLPSLRHPGPYPHNSSLSKGNNAHARIPSLTLPPPIVSSFVFDDEDEDEDEDNEDECDVSQPPLTQIANRTTLRPQRHTQRNPHTGAHTAPLLAAFPAPPPTSLALRLSLHLPKTSLFFDDLEEDLGEGEEVEDGLEGEREEVEGELGEDGEDGLEGEGEEGEEGEGMRESSPDITSITSIPNIPDIPSIPDIPNSAALPALVLLLVRPARALLRAAPTHTTSPAPTLAPAGRSIGDPGDARPPFVYVI
ncbi:hypothetical protein EYR38_008872 [Pleurotus pulmonarius]|nr:hypothetical protein EYR38_008872 [Pleurotus pulmonarius]